MIVINENIEISVLNCIENRASFDLEKSIYDLDTKIEMLSSQADNLDYLISVASGILCSMLDILWVGAFSLDNGRNIAEEQVNGFVIKVAQIQGCKKDDIQSCVSFLENKFSLASDGNTPEFGGGKQHHLRDFAHHPSPMGLIFSIFTQFSGYSYGTDVTGAFKIYPVRERSKKHIGNDIADKLYKGIITWFFHLVSDMAGSSSTAGLSGGTGIPGPILSIAKELSVLPIFKNLKVNDGSLSKFLSKLFNGTLLSENGNKIKFDLRGELGLGIELGKQAIPVVANDCIVRFFYFIRRVSIEIKDNKINSLNDLSNIDWNKVKPKNSLTLTRMLTAATGVFTTIDVSAACLTSNPFVYVNYIGVGRFAVALGEESLALLKVRDLKYIRDMYQEIERNTYTKKDDRIYERIVDDMNFDKMTLNIEQTEVLYNLQYYKVLNDISLTNSPFDKESFILLKREWLKEWKSYMELGFSAFMQDENAVLNWYTKDEIHEIVKKNDNNKPWLRLVLLEAMLFEPYYALGTETNNKGEEVLTKKFDNLKLPFVGYNRKEADIFLDSFFPIDYLQIGYVKRLRVSYDRITNEISDVKNAIVKTLTITSVSMVVLIATAGAFAPFIATALVGSQFAGLSGAALTSASLAYLGGGAIAVGGLGMAGGTAAIVGGGAILGIGFGASIGGAVGLASIAGRKATILQSAKLMVSMREVFVNDEHDIELSNTVYEVYVQRIIEIEKGLVELRLKAEDASSDQKKKILQEIKNAEESVEVMKIARKSMLRYNSSFEEGLALLTTE